MTGAVCAADPTTYGGDVEFLGKHTQVIELKNGDGAVALAPDQASSTRLATDEKAAAAVPLMFSQMGARAMPRSVAAWAMAPQVWLAAT